MEVDEGPLAILHLRDITAQRHAEASQETAQRRLEEAIDAHA